MRNPAHTFGESSQSGGNYQECGLQGLTDILLVAARLDASAERIINYLAERSGLDINAVFINYAKLSDGKEILIPVCAGSRSNNGRQTQDWKEETQ